MRSLARARSSSRRAPPNAASKPCSAIASSSVTVCSWLREARGPVSSTDAALVDRLLHAGDDQPLAELGHAAVAELDHLGEVVPGVDVHQRERERRRAEGLLGQAQQHDRVLAAAEQQHRSLELGRDLAHHVDRLGLQRPQVAQLRAAGDGHPKVRRIDDFYVQATLGLVGAGPAAVAAAAGLRARRAADRLIALVVQRVVRQVALVDTPPQVLVGPVRQRVVLPQAAHVVAFDQLGAWRASGPARGGCP